jgi:hypothetical protein
MINGCFLARIKLIVLISPNFQSNQKAFSIAEKAFCILGLFVLFLRYVL